MADKDKAEKHSHIGMRLDELWEQWPFFCAKWRRHKQRMSKYPTTLIHSLSSEQLEELALVDTPEWEEDFVTRC